eukprot:TRINITY_DN30012_c0_g1_i1.p1 TRINITY_DN30012_c0_g1~~TRINITY_DN30012_c0_g1_i1.p1  ORF type:complete len:346 (+),score=69.78 TRINITY_DN30012_c0_g1_i1:111-1148(+)
MAPGIDPAFESLGSPKAGLLIWRIENLKVVPLPQKEYGKFHTGDSYIVLKTTETAPNKFDLAAHFWIGKESSQDEYAVAALKTVELDDHYGGRAVQYREVQGLESELFLSYFQPCIIALPGGVASGLKKPEKEEQEPHLYQLKGINKLVRVREVPMVAASLNHGDIFILDTASTLYQFQGTGASISERMHARNILQHLNKEHKGGSCKTVTIEDDGAPSDDEATEFWNLLGGFAEIPEKSAAEEDLEARSTTPAVLSLVSKSSTKVIATGELQRSQLESPHCYLVDTGFSLLVWTGSAASAEDKQAAAKAAEDLLKEEKRPQSARVIRIPEGKETPMFKSNFDGW